MTPQTVTLKSHDGETSPGFACQPSTAHRLTNTDEPEVLDFLEERPLHNVIMIGFIRDNGIESELNRGSFYGSRNESGTLDGVALIGHAIFIEAHTDLALRSFALVAQDCKLPHMILGERQTVQRFWHLFRQDDLLPAIHRREVLLELTSPAIPGAPFTGLRKANVEDLSLVAPIHAALAATESGTNPLEIDADGFQARCRRRIERGRVWILTEGSKLVFKTDVVSETPKVNYLEGVYVHPDEQGKGFGSRCFAEVARCLLQQTKSIAVLVNEAHYEAQGFFQNLGFVTRANYETIFLGSTAPFSAAR